MNVRSNSTRGVLANLSVARAVLTTLPALGVVTLSTTLAAPAVDQQAVRRDVHAGRFMPLSDILRSVQTAHPGRVIAVDLKTGRSGRAHYEIQLLDGAGQWLRIDVDPATGMQVEPPSTPVDNLLSMAESLRRLLAEHTGFVRRVQLEYPDDAPPQYDVRLVRADGCEGRYAVDARTGQLIEPVGIAAPMPSMQPLPDLIEAMEQRYVGRAVEANLRVDGRDAPYLELELELQADRQVEIIVDPASGAVTNEVY